MRLWRLCVRDNTGNSQFIDGTEEVIRGAFEELREAMCCVDGTGMSVFTCVGFDDSGNRLAVELAIRVNLVGSVMIIQQ